jgi:(p)ppGpp synthase/HD superfamily hydrolase
MNTHRLETAISFAMRAHHGQTRKGEDTPYVVHPLAVSLLLAQYGFDEDIVIGGILHDVIEDTDASLDDIAELFGDSVASLVASVSHNETLPWIDKKKYYIELVRAGGEGAKAISTADKIANAESLLQSYAMVGPTLWNASMRGVRRNYGLNMRCSPCFKKPGTTHSSSCMRGTLRAWMN